MSTIVVRDSWKPYLCGIATAVTVGWVYRRLSVPCGHAPKADAPECMGNEDFMNWGQSLLQWIVQYRQDCRTKKCISTVAPNYLRDALPAEAPEEGEPWQAIMAVTLDSPLHAQSPAQSPATAVRASAALTPPCTVQDLDDKIAPGLTHWEASNKFFAYFKPHSSYPAVLGEMLCAGINVMVPVCNAIQLRFSAFNPV